jgi:cellulose biosynthesis protein BcsQ
VRGKTDLASHVHATDIVGLDVVPADFSLRNLDLHLDATKRPTARLAELLRPLEDRYDVALLDCPPSISLASESVFGATDGLIVPVIPTTLSARTLAQLAAFLDDDRYVPRLLPHFSMVDRRKKLHREVIETLPAEWPAFLHTAIPMSSAVERMAVHRGPVATFARDSDAARAFRLLWEEVAARLW